MLGSGLFGLGAKAKPHPSEVKSPTPKQRIVGMGYPDKICLTGMTPASETEFRGLSNEGCSCSGVLLRILLFQGLGV